MPDVAAALELGALGWSVVPVHSVVGERCDCGNPGCPSPGKHPCVRWTDALTEAARPDQIEDWWQHWRSQEERPGGPIQTPIPSRGT